jgi:hypothetical protein
MKEILIKARDLISDPKRWTKSTYARRQDGSPCSALNAEAVCFCAVGAIARATDGHFEPTVALVKQLKMLCGGDVIDFNDSHSHAEVLALFDKAIGS